MTTFITFIGKGKKLADHRFEYETVNYRFSRTEIRASCFANAVMRSGEYAFDRVWVIGTPSSTWAQLLEHPSPEEEDLFLELDDAGLVRQAKLRPRLVEALRKRWSLSDVRLLVHPAELTGHESEIMSDYMRLLLETPGDIVLDVTHSFRWMPQFLTAALQVADALSPARRVEVLYGELSADKSVCPVRKLDELLNAGQLAQDIRMFFEKWEAGPLAARLDGVWPSGAAALRVLGGHLQGNYLLPLVWDPESRGPGRPLLQLKNALEELLDRADLPMWLESLRSRLEELRRQLADPATGPLRLWHLAALYAERQMYGQALLCQECTLRLFVWEWTRDPDYPDWERLGKAMKKYEKSANTPKQYWNILHNRNVVAHGALRGRGENAGVPAAANLPKQFQSQQDYLKRLLGIG